MAELALIVIGNKDADGWYPVSYQVGDRLEHGRYKNVPDFPKSVSIDWNKEWEWDENFNKVKASPRVCQSFNFYGKTYYAMKISCKGLVFTYSDFYTMEKEKSYEVAEMFMF